MFGLGTIANSVAIVVGAVFGLFFKRGLPEKFQKTMMEAIGLCVVVIGVQMALKAENIVLIICSLAAGCVIGEALGVEDAINKLSAVIGKRVSGGDASAAGAIADGFFNASILFCSGAMGVVGSVQDGLTGDHTTLFAKATLDGIISLVMAANMGIGVALSGISVAIYQGIITLLAGFIGPYATPAVLNGITAIGGIMIMAIGTNMLKITSIRVGNTLPGIIVVVVLTLILA